MTKIIQGIGILILFLSFVLIRAFASKLFYDPFITYFKNDYLHKAIPEFNSVKLVLNILYRYLLNFFLSMGIIYLLFQKQYLKFSIWFYTIAFVILIILFFIIIQFIESYTYLPLFYIRRFLIHPIFVLLLIPAFYYQKQHAKT